MIDSKPIRVRANYVHTKVPVHHKIQKAIGKKPHAFSTISWLVSILIWLVSHDMYHTLQYVVRYWQPWSESTQYFSLRFRLESRSRVLGSYLCVQRVLCKSQLPLHIINEELCFTKYKEGAEQLLYILPTPAWLAWSINPKGHNLTFSCSIVPLCCWPKFTSPLLNVPT